MDGVLELLAEGCTDLLCVKVVDDRGRDGDGVSGGIPIPRQIQQHQKGKCIPSNDDLLGLGALVELEHGLVELDVHQGLVADLLVLHGEGPTDLDVAALTHDTEERADHALLLVLLVASHVVVQDRKNDGRVDLQNKGTRVVQSARGQKRKGGGKKAYADTVHARRNRRQGHLRLARLERQLLLCERHAARANLLGMLLRKRWLCLSRSVPGPAFRRRMHVGYYFPQKKLQKQRIGDMLDFLRYDGPEMPIWAGVTCIITQG